MGFISVLLLLGCIPQLSFATGDICFVCRKEIRFSIYSWTDKVAHSKVILCRECSDLPNNCYLCSVPVLKTFTELPDGRVICKRDLGSVVLEERQAIQICEQVKQDIDRQFIRFITMPASNITLQLMDRIRLQELFKVIGNDYTCPNALGCTETKTNAGQREFEISLLSGLPKEDLMTTSAHEYTHVWINENVPPSRQKTLGKDAVEGFCELLAYLFAEQKGLPAGKSNILANLYTRGQIHLFIAANRQYGLNDIVDWMKGGEDALLVKDDLSRIRRLADAPKPKSAPPPIPPNTSNVISTVSVPVSLPVSLKLQGIVWAARPSAMINGQTVEPEQELSVSLKGGPVRVRCLAITPITVTLQTNASPQLLELKLN
jgi:hypothetical protein